MSGPQIVASFVAVSFSLIILAWAVAHAIEVRAMTQKQHWQ